MSTGELLRIVRQIKGLPQKAIANKLGIKQPAYYKWEKSKSVKGEKLERFLKAANCSKTEFEQIEKFSPAII